MPARTATDPVRVLPLQANAPDELVAGSLRLLEQLATDPTPTLRWYRSTSTAVVLGRGHGSLPAPSPSTRVPVLSRPSGGGAVLLDPDLLSLDVAIPVGHRLLGADLSSVFVPIGHAWAEALRGLGVAGLSVHTGPAAARRRGDARQRLLAAICFATLGRGEVLAGRRKLVGLSQRRRKHGALVQCGLVWRWRPAGLLEALGADPDDPEIHGAAVGLADLVAEPQSIAAVVDAVSTSLRGWLTRA